MLQPNNRQYMLHIRSKDCEQLTSGFNTHLLLNVNPAIERITGHEFHISLSSAEIPFTWYNVSDDLHSRQIFVDGSQSLQLVKGNYNIHELITAINAQNTAGSFPYSASYDAKTNKVTLANTDATGHKINFSQEDSRELSKMLGFSRDDITVVANTSITSDGTVNLRPVHSLFLYSNLAATNVITSTDGIEQVIDKIPLGSFEPLSTITFDFSTTAPFSSVITTQAINSLELSLRDQNGRLVQLNGARYELSLIIEQRLSYSLEVEHPSHPYPTISSRRSLGTGRRSLETKEDKDKEGTAAVSPRLQSRASASSLGMPPPPSGLSDPRSPRPQPQGGSTIPIVSNTPTLPTVKRPRVDEVQLKRKELELDQAILLAADL